MAQARTERKAQACKGYACFWLQKYAWKIVRQPTARPGWGLVVSSQACPVARAGRRAIYPGWVYIYK